MASGIHNFNRFRTCAYQWRVVLCNLLVLLWGGAGLVCSTHAELIAETLGYDLPESLIPPGGEADRTAKSTSANTDEHQSEVRTSERQAVGSWEHEALLLSSPVPRQSPPTLDGVAETRRDSSGPRTVVGRTPDGQIESESSFDSSYSSPRAGGYGQEHSVSPGLEWLSDHQNVGGYWSARYSDQDSLRTDATSSPFADIHPRAARSYGNAYADVAVTALALKCFIDSGYDHKAGEYRKTVRQCLLWLRKIQRRDGSFEGARNLHDHSFVVTALVETYGLSGDRALKPICDRAVEYLLSKRSPGSGWGQDSHYAPDMESTWYAVFALKSARMAGLEVASRAAWDDVGEFLDLMAADADGETVTRWSAASDLEPGATAYDLIVKSFVHAAWVATALFIGHTDLDDERIKRRTDFLVRDENLPRYEYPRVDFRTWYAASVALYQCGGENWKTWEDALATALLDNQRGYTESDKSSEWTTKATLREHGSWDPIDTADEFGGRVYTTTMASRILDFRYRYIRLEENG